MLFKKQLVLFKKRWSFGPRLSGLWWKVDFTIRYIIKIVHQSMPCLGLFVAHIAIICKITKTTTPLIVGLGQRPTSGHSRCIFCLIFNYYVMHFLNWQWPVLFDETRTKNGLRFTVDQFYKKRILRSCENDQHFSFKRVRSVSRSLPIQNYKKY